MALTGCSLGALALVHFAAFALVLAKKVHSPIAALKFTTLAVKKCTSHAWQTCNVEAKRQPAERSKCTEWFIMEVL